MDYTCVSCTNYFRVTDEDRLAEIISNAFTSNGEEVELFSDTNAKGGTLWGFGAYGSIDGYRNFFTGDVDSDFNMDFYSFTKDLQEILADDDVIIIQEAGHEELRYVTAIAWVISKTEVRTLDLADLIISTCEEMSGVDEYKVGRLEY